ncbi:site-specific integrase [Lysinibacillus endophyticus]|uniref:tyrosine-type recombinase/integrase n=1 Tax=Ureibacillus endophyticus TaxID=1978490 RepID=UPI00313646D2
MTKKSGVFDVEVDLNLLRLDKDTSFNQKKVASKSQTIEDAIQIVKKQMISSGLRPRTIRDYETIVVHFMNNQSINYLNEITLDTIYDWLEQMEVSNQTKLTRLKALKSFLSKCYTNGWFEMKFWQDVNIKVDKKIKTGANGKDVQLLISLLDLNTFIGLRDAVAILTMYKTGIRINTLGKLEEKHIDFDEKTLLLEGKILKNHKVLKLPIDDQMCQLYQLLIRQNNKIRQHYQQNNENIFISYKGTPINTKSTNNAISKQLTKYSKQFGLKNISGHALRRAYAKNLLSSGASIPLISKALGHSNLEVTTQYLDLDVDEVSNSLREYL